MMALPFQAVGFGNAEAQAGKPMLRYFVISMIFAAKRLPISFCAAVSK